MGWKTSHAGASVLASLLLVVVTSASASTSGGTRGLATDEREVWVSAQDGSAVMIMAEAGAMETIALPAREKPHTIEFSRTGRYAYVSDVGAGDLIVVRARDRRVVSTLAFGSTRTHQAKPSPDGSFLLVAEQAPLRAVVKVAADEAGETWTPLGAPLTLPGTPDCTVFTRDGRRAYVSLKPSGIAVLDVVAFALLRTLPTDGEVACALVASKDGRTVFVAANGGRGHFYRLDTAQDTLTEAPYEIGAVDLHGLAVTRDERIAIVASRGSDELKILDLRGTGVETVSVDATPNVLDRPDMPTIRGETAFVALRTTGKVAVLRASAPHAVRYIDVAPPSPNAVHGMGVRPDTTPPAVSIALPRQTLQSVRSRGVWARVRCSESCDIVVRVLLKAINRALFLGAAAVTLPARGEKVVVVKLTGAARKRLATPKRAELELRIRATDASGNSSVATRKLVLSR